MEHKIAIVSPGLCRDHMAEITRISVLKKIIHTETTKHKKTDLNTFLEDNWQLV